MKKTKFILSLVLAVVLTVCVVLPIISVYAEEGTGSSNSEFEPNDIQFLKYEKETSATGKGDNVHTICLDILPPTNSDSIAVLLVMDTTSSMTSSCAACGASKTYHPSKSFKYANWEGETVTTYACSDFVDRKVISEEAALAFIDNLEDLSDNADNLYVRIVPFGGTATTDYTGWIDLTETEGVADAKAAIRGLPQLSSTNISAGLRSAYEIISGNLPGGLTSENTYVVMMTDGSQSKSDTANLPQELLNDEAFLNKWLTIWSNYDHFEQIENDEIDIGFYIGSPYYAELITDDNGLASHLYTVLLGENLDFGAKNGIEKNQKYNPGIGIDSKDFMASFSDYSSFVTTADDMTAYYNNILRTLSASLTAITVTDPMSEYVDFLTFTDSDGEPTSTGAATYDSNTGTITWDPLNAIPDSDGHYRLYYNIRLKTEMSGVVPGGEYPANGTTTAAYTLTFPDGHTENLQKISEIPYIELELDEDGPFYVVSLDRDYPTLQEAVDAAAATDTILIHPCEDFGVTEYDSSYATNNTDHISEIGGGEVYIEGKSLTIKSEEGKETAPLKDFAIVVEGQQNGLDYTFEDIKFTGSSIIIFDNYAANANFGTITVTECYADTCTPTSQRTLLKYPHSLGNTHSSSAFLQWVQYPPNVHDKNGTTDELIFTGNTVKGTLHPTNPGKDQEYSPAYTPFISGGAGIKAATISGNTLGDYSHNNAIYGIVFQTVADNADITVSNNTAYLTNRSSVFVWVGEFQTSTIYNVSVKVDNNDLFTGTSLVNWEGKRTRPYTLNSTFDVATPAFSVVRINDRLNGTAVTHHNYVNNFCYNTIKVAIVSGNTFEANEQHGHTYDEHIKDVPAGMEKAEDIYQGGFADAFNGTTHSDPIVELGTTHYCERCDELRGYFTIVHSSDDSSETIYLDKLDEDGIFDITTKVKEGYLYGGLAVDDTFTAAKSDVNGLSLTPAAGTTYYLREVDEKYLAPFLLSVQKTKTSAIVRYLVTVLDGAGVDAGFYQSYGFLYGTDINGTIDVRAAAAADRDEALNNMTGVLYGGIEVYKQTVTDAYLALGPADLGGIAGDYLGCLALNPSQKTPATQKFMNGDSAAPTELFSYDYCFVPCYVTADGVVVTGTLTKYFAESDSVKPDTYNVEGESQTGESPTPVSGPVNHSVSVAARFVVDPDRIAPVTLTVNAAGRVLTVTAAKGDCTALVSAPAVEGCAFAGWYRDPACTVPADLSEVEEDTVIYAKYKPIEQKSAKPAQKNVWTSPIVRLTVAIRGIMDALENAIRTAFNFAGKLFSR